MDHNLFEYLHKVAGKLGIKFVDVSSNVIEEFNGVNVGSSSSSSSSSSSINFDLSGIFTQVSPEQFWQAAEQCNPALRHPQAAPQLVLHRQNISFISSGGAGAFILCTGVKILGDFFQPHSSGSV